MKKVIKTYSVQALGDPKKDIGYVHVLDNGQYTGVARPSYGYAHKLPMFSSLANVYMAILAVNTGGLRKEQIELNRPKFRYA